MSIYGNRQRLRPQTVALAGRTGPVGHKLGDFIANVFRRGLAEAPLQVGDNPLKRHIVG